TCTVTMDVEMRSEAERAFALIAWCAAMERGTAMIFVLLLAAMLIGAGQPLQAAINAQLRAHLGDPAWATCISVAVSFTFVALYLLIRRLPPPALKAAAGAPWWMWTGGLFGVVFVALGLIVTPRLGAGITFAVIVLGQMIISLALDQWG